jgi:hypothetical protein
MRLNAMKFDQQKIFTKTHFAFGERKIDYVMENEESTFGFSVRA